MLQRWNQHLANAKAKRGRGCLHFWNAIRAYGKDAFQHEVLEVCHSLESANAAEEKWILHFDAHNPAKGFNIKRGGGHVPHPVRNPWDRPEYREKSIKAARAKWQDPDFVAKHRANAEKRRGQAPWNKGLRSHPSQLGKTPHNKGVPSPFRGVRVTAEQIKARHPGYVELDGPVGAEILARHFAGESQRDLAREYGIARRRLVAFVKAYRAANPGVVPVRKPTPNKGKPLPKTLEIRRRRAEGASTAELAVEFGLTRAGVKAACRGLGRLKPKA